MELELLYFCILMLSCISCGCLAYYFVHLFVRKYFSGGEDQKEKRENALIPLLAPMALYLKGKEEDSEFVRRKVSEYNQHILEAGGFWGGLNGYEVLSAQFTLAFLVPCFLFLSGFFLVVGFWLFVLFALVFAMVAYMYPSSVLQAQARNRQQQFLKQLPSALDILRVAAEAGLDFHSSAKYLVQIFIPGPVKEEMIMFEQEVILGKPAGEGLKNIAKRVNLPEVSTVFVALAQSIEMGTSMTTMLATSAAEMRRKRILSAESEAQKAIVKITFPLLLLILPGVFIILLGPIAKNLINSFGF